MRLQRLGSRSNKESTVCYFAAKISIISKKTNRNCKILNDKGMRLHRSQGYVILRFSRKALNAGR